MRTLAIGLLMLLLGAATARAATPASPPERPPDFSGFDAGATSAHFQLHWRRTDPARPRDPQGILAWGEAIHAAIAGLVGERRLPRRRVHVLLDGTGMVKGGRPHFPNVDEYSVMRLYTYPGPSGGYFEPFAHELMHALRHDVRRVHERIHREPGFGFVEEGFAEYVANMVMPQSSGFANYGYPPDLVAGFWLTTDQEVPLELLESRHDLNVRALAQAYPLRASFFRFLHATYGPALVADLAYTSGPITRERYREVFGRSFTELADAWRPWALQRFHAIPDATARGREFHDKTPIHYFPKLRPGVDFPRPARATASPP